MIKLCDLVKSSVNVGKYYIKYLFLTFTIANGSNNLNGSYLKKNCT